MWDGNRLIEQKPERKVAKTVECWVNFYPNGEMYAYDTKYEADAIGKTLMRRLSGKAFHFVGQYTEEE